MRFHILVVFCLIAFDASAQFHSTPAAKEFRASVMPMDQRKRLAVPLLETAEKDAAKLDDVNRAIVLYRVAGGWMPLDQKRSAAIYRQAFLASLHANDAIRPALEYMILDEAIPLAPYAILELTLQADKLAQEKLYHAVLTYALMSRDMKLAAQTFQAAVDNQAVTRRMSATALASFSLAERAQAFRTLTPFYKQHPVPNWSWAFSGLISQFYSSLPPEDVLAAIDVILQYSAGYDSKHSGGQTSMSSGPNNISFQTETDFQLFAVGPALEKLDPARATTLLREHPATAKWLAKYPQGLESFDQNHSFHGGDLIQPSSIMPRDLRTFEDAEANEQPSLSADDYGLEFTRADFPAYIEPNGASGEFFETFADHHSPEYSAYQAVVNMPDAEVLIAVDSVPVIRKIPMTCGGPNGAWCNYAETYPQAEVVRSLAEHWTYHGIEENARAALVALPVVLEKIPAQRRCTPLADAADLYLRMGDRDAASAVVQVGLSAAAEAVAQEDAAYKLSVAELLRPSSACYQEIISAGVNAAYRFLYMTVTSLSSPARRAFAAAMLARSLLGVPLRRELQVSANGGYVFREGEVSYSGTF